MKCLGRVQRTGMSSNGLPNPVWYHRGSQRASQEMHVCSEYETVTLVSHRSCLFYKTRLKAGNISTALNHALGKISTGHSSSHPLESWEVLPWTRYQVVQFGPTVEDRQDVTESCFGYRTEKWASQLVILLIKSPFWRIQPQALKQPSGIHSGAIVCFLFERTPLVQPKL